MANFIITAESKPILDGWGWADYWTKEDWQKWHSLMVKKYGEAIAKQNFLSWWEKQDSFANPYNWAKYDKNFVNYLSKYGIDISSIVSAPIIATQNTVNSVSAAVSNSAKVLKYAAPVLLVAGTALLIMYGYHKAQKA